MIVPENRKYSELLKKEGLKNTKHRNSILEIIEKSDQPISAEQIYLTLKEKNTSINLSSVYRILDSLVAKEIVIKASILGEAKALFELNRLEHKHHLICSGCKKMFLVDGCPMDEYEKQLRNKLGFAVTGHKLEIYGICKECKECKACKDN
jgi:Fur family ferric uptake transcriptional regulator